MDPFDSMSQYDSRRIMLHAAFANLEKLAVPVTQPRFIFAHILAPHPPFVFDADGKSVRSKDMTYSIVDGDHFYQNGGTPQEYATGYAGQVTYIDKLVLKAVDALQKNSRRPPVIIIQGDHGSKLRLNQELLEKTDVNECFPNLNAFFVPKEVRGKLYDNITPVNSFRILFNTLFQDNFAKLEDRSYYSGWSSPFRFTEVTKRILSVK
jgi:phosphoglycerol transferase MdoB-like AlkP superfamily enzyme